MALANDMLHDDQRATNQRTTPVRLRLGFTRYNSQHD